MARKKSKNKKDKIKEKAKKGIEKKKKKLKELKTINNPSSAKKEFLGKIKKIIIFSLITGLVVSIILFLYTRIWYKSLIGFFAAVIVVLIGAFFQIKLKQSARIRKIEGVFPDFLQLMSSNLRAGMTIDRAMLLSSRPEFSPLDQEILRTGKEIATGKGIATALEDMSRRIGSEKIEKTILLIISGIKAGGSLDVLLEQTAVNMRERNFVEKKAGGNVLMYVIFIFVAVAVGAPVLFGLSNILVETLTEILSGLPSIDAQTTSQMTMPFSLTSVNISVEFINYFCIAFIFVIDVLASLVLGLIMKGEEKEGLKYLLPMILISFAIFFLIKLILSGVVASLFG
jgi:Flp pilus assembly protein TadB